MIFIIFASSFISVGLSQYSTAYSEQKRPTSTVNYYQAAPLHYVKIGKKLDGDYKFGYDTGKGPLGQSFREEMRLADGTITGTYGLVDDQGHKRVVHYSAGTGGFIAKEDKVNNTVKPVQQVPYKQYRKLPTRAPLKTLPLHTSKHSILEQPQKYMLVKSTPSLKRKSTSQQNRVAQNPIYQTEASLHADKSSPSLSGPYQATKPMYKENNQFSSVEDFRMPKAHSQDRLKQYSPNEYREPERKSFSKPKLSSVELYSPMTSQHQEINSPSIEDVYLRNPKLLSQEVSVETMATLTEEPRRVYEQEIPNSNIVNYNEFPGLLRNDLKVSTVPAYNERSQDFLKSTYDSSVNTQREKTIGRNQGSRFSSINMQTNNKQMEDEYYDNAPVYIDVERLSYNIGTGKASSQY